MLSGCRCCTLRGPASCLHGAGHREPAGQEEVRDHQDRRCCGTWPPAKREMCWPQMSTGDLAGGFGSHLKAIGECHYHDNSCTKPVTKKSLILPLSFTQGGDFCRHGPVTDCLQNLGEELLRAC